MTPAAGTRDLVSNEEAQEKPEPAERDRSEKEQIAAAIAELRQMHESSEQLNETVEEARDAVQAAHEADSMRSSGAQGYGAEDEGPQASG